MLGNNVEDWGQGPAARGQHCLGTYHAELNDFTTLSRKITHFKHILV